MHNSMWRVVLIGSLASVWILPPVFIGAVALWRRSPAFVRGASEGTTRAIGLRCSIDMCEIPKPGVKRYTGLVLHESTTSTPVCSVKSASVRNHRGGQLAEITGASLTHDAWLAFWRICDEWLAGKRDFVADKLTVECRNSRFLADSDGSGKAARDSPSGTDLWLSLKAEFSSSSDARTVTCQVFFAENNGSDSPDEGESHSTVQGSQPALYIVWQSFPKDGSLYLTKRLRITKPGIPLRLLEPVWSGMPGVPTRIRFAGTIDATVAFTRETRSTWSASVSGRLFWSRNELAMSWPSLLDWLDAEGSLVLDRVALVNGRLKSGQVALYAGPGKMEAGFLNLLRNCFSTSVFLQDEESSSFSRVITHGPLISENVAIPRESTIDREIAITYEKVAASGIKTQIDSLPQQDNVSFRRVALKLQCDASGVRILPADGDDPSWVILDSGMGGSITISDKTLGQQTAWNQIMNHLVGLAEATDFEDDWSRRFVQFLVRCLPIEKIIALRGEDQDVEPRSAEGFSG